MGFNYATIGYASVQDMFNAFSRSDRDQVFGFFDFIQGVLPGAGAVKVLQAKNFTQFASSFLSAGIINPLCPSNDKACDCSDCYQPRFSAAKFQLISLSRTALT